MINIKNRGGLMKPSQDVLKVVKVVDSILTANFESITKKKNNFVFEVVLKTHHAVLEVCPNVFTDFESHSQIKSHRSKIIESIAGIYSTVRLHYRLKNKDAGFRRMSSKVVLFQHK